MEEKKINKMLRRRFSGVGWTLLCYYGICGDLFKVTPMLIEAIKAAKAAK